MKIKYELEGHSTAKAIIGFLIVIIAFGVLSLFTANKETIIASSLFPSFVLFTALGMIFLVVLLYLVDRPLWETHKATRKTSHKKRG